jgi:hypothetical protein
MPKREVVISDDDKSLTYILTNMDGSVMIRQGKNQACLSLSELRRLNGSESTGESRSPSHARLMRYPVVADGMA